MQAKQLEPAGGIFRESNRSLKPDGRLSLYQVIGTAFMTRWTLTATCASNVAAIPSPHLNSILYFGGLLIKLEQSDDLGNWTLGPGNSSGSNHRNTKCYRIDVTAVGGVGLGRFGVRCGRIDARWYTRARCTLTS